EAVADGLGSSTPAAMPGDCGAPKGYRTYRPVLVAEKARHVGDGVGFVVAETAAQAQDAAELVKVEYEPLAAVVSPADAAAEGAARVWDDCPTGNVAWGLMFGSQDATDAAFARADHAVGLRL